jgi:threonine dehydrogenase-like Zn-dependent dehydrogenase
MQALVLENGRLAVQERPVPLPGPGEALVRVLMAGVCNTDLEIAKGYMGFSGVLGHELCGVVEACAEQPRLIGRRVAGEINLACRTCELCARGLTRHCPHRTVMGIAGKDGCFAEYVTLPVANLHVLPPAIDDVRACFVEPVAAACEVLEQITVMPRDRVAVLGDGKLGLLVAQALATTGCALTLAGKHDRKLRLARDRGIATAALADLPRKAFDVVIEATGSPAGMHAAIELVRPRGTIVLKSTYHGKLVLDAAPLVIDELHVVGSRCGPFEVAIPALASGAIRPEDMVDAVLPLSQAEAAFERAAEPSVLKVLLDMRAGSVG